MAYNKRKRQTTIPFRSRKKRTTSYKKKKSSYRRRGIPAGIVSNTKIFKLRYNTVVTLNSGIGTIAEHVFRANSIHDPDWTGIGHQPLGHDELATLYEHYVVMGCRMTAVVVSPGNTVSTDSGVCGIYTHDDTAALTGTRETLLEQRNAKYKYYGNSQGTRSTVTLKKGFSARKFFGKEIMQESNYGAQFGQNPNSQAYIHLWAASLDGADAGIMNVNVTIDYVIKLTKPIKLAQS